MKTKQLALYNLVNMSAFLIPFILFYSFCSFAINGFLANEIIVYVTLVTFIDAYMNFNYNFSNYNLMSRTSFFLSYVIVGLVCAVFCSMTFLILSFRIDTLYQNLFDDNIFFNIIYTFSLSTLFAMVGLFIGAFILRKKAIKTFLYLGLLITIIIILSILELTTPIKFYTLIGYLLTPIFSKAIFSIIFYELLSCMFFILSYYIIKKVETR